MLTNTTNVPGIYAVTLFVRGIPTVISVDDMFLFETSKPLQDGTELWAPLLSKAWAKAKGSYASQE